MPQQTKKKKAEPISRRVVDVGNDRSVRIAVYPPRDGQTTGVTLGIGKGGPNTYSKIFFEVTPENWEEINREVMNALRVAGHKDLIDFAKELGVKPTRPTRSKTTKRAAQEASETDEATEAGTGPDVADAGSQAAPPNATAADPEGTTAPAPPKDPKTVVVSRLPTGSRRRIS